MDGNAHLYVRIFKDDGIVHVARFFERGKHDGVPDFFGAFDACVCTDPAIANDVGVADDGALADNAEGESRFVAVGLELFFEGGGDFGLGLVEKLGIDQFGRNFGKHQDTAAAHLVADMHGVSDHVADFSATDDGTDVL